MCGLPQIDSLFWSQNVGLLPSQPAFCEVLLDGSLHSFCGVSKCRLIGRPSKLAVNMRVSTASHTVPECSFKVITVISI